MAAPFSGEEFYAKRSFFSSLLGLKFGRQQSTKLNVPLPHPPPQQHVGSDQPCSSRTILTHVPPMEANISIHNQTINHNPYLLSDGDFEGRDRSLSDQLADTLLLTSHHASPEPHQQQLQQQIHQQNQQFQELQEQSSMLSPHDIYEEIVCECALLDQQTSEAHHQHHHHHNHLQQQHQHQHQQQHPQSQMHENQYYHIQNQQQMHSPMQPSMQLQNQQQQLQQQQQSIIPNYYQYSPSPAVQYSNAAPIPEASPTSPPNFCFNCQNCQNNSNNNNNSIMNNETRLKASMIEELANKTSLEDLVKLVVAAVKDAGGLGKNDKKQEESPEEILRRKRQQNNEAAARYRKRQREAKMNSSSELEEITTRNVELKAELTLLQEQINNLKSKITNYGKQQIQIEIPPTLSSI